MFYSNDDTDKEIRKRNYLLNVFGIPIIIALAIAGITYLAYSKRYISSVDRTFCYFISFSIATFLYAKNKVKWLKIPDGTYYRVQDENNYSKNSLNEPIEYDRIYYVSKKKKTISLIAGLVFTGLAIYIFKATKSYIISIVNLLLGLLVITQATKGLFDKTPKLKLSTIGIWTNKLGFIRWDKINNTKIITEQRGEHPSIVLEIYLKNTIYEEANKPDERLLLDEIEDASFIETDINVLRQ